MCFSPQASFLAAGVLGALGVACVSNAKRLSEKPMAAIPLLFAAQQALEGFIWLSPTHDGRVSNACVVGYLVVAKVFWPVYAPLAVLLIEPVAFRRRIMGACAAIGAIIAAYLAWGLTAFPQWADLRRAHIAYGTDQPIPLPLAFAYVTVVCLSLLASSQPAIVGFGVIVLAGAIYSYAEAVFAFPSVWCFFAAAASGVLVFHFARARRLERPTSQAPSLSQA
jgi:hypothetical protein